MCDFDDYMLSVRLHGLLAAKKTAGRTARVPVAIVYYLRTLKDVSSLAYPPRLAVDLGFYVDDEAHGWAR